VTHAGDWAHIGLALDANIGVDIEALRSLPDLTTLAQRFFVPRECACLLALPPAEHIQAFFRI